MAVRLGQLKYSKEHSLVLIRYIEDVAYSVEELRKHNTRTFLDGLGQISNRFAFCQSLQGRIRQIFFVPSA